MPTVAHAVYDYLSRRESIGVLERSGLRFDDVSRGVEDIVAPRPWHVAAPESAAFAISAWGFLRLDRVMIPYLRAVNVSPDALNIHPRNMRWFNQMADAAVDPEYVEGVARAGVTGFYDIVDAWRESTPAEYLLASRS